MSAGKPESSLGRIARVVLILIGVSPFLPRLLAPVPGLAVLGGAFEAWFAFQCHRESARTLSVLGELLPVCSRCFGIYAGLGLGALVLRPRLGTTMVPGDQGYQGSLFAGDVREIGILDQVEAVPVMPAIGDELAHVV